MSDYRRYRLDGTGKISQVEVISAPNDEQAVRKARAAKHPMRSELWLRDRRVAEFAPTKDPAGTRRRGARRAG